MRGDGQLHVWGKVVYTANGNTLSGMLQACGIALPPTTLTALGGGGMIQIDVPNDKWEAPSMPRFQVDGTQTALERRRHAELQLRGAGRVHDGRRRHRRLAGLLHRHHDDERRRGGHARGAHGGPAERRYGYTLPPTSIAQSARADQLYIVMRQVTSATLTRTACDQASGSATFMHLNNHVVGCHVMGGSDCMPDEITFIDNEPHDLRDHQRDRPDQGRRGHRHLCRRARRAADVEAVGE